MKVAFHFNEDDPSVKGKVKAPPLAFLARFFSALREGDRDSTAHVKIWHGLYGACEYGQTLQQRMAIATGLFQNGQSLWTEVDMPRFLDGIFTTAVYVIVVEGLSVELRDQIHAALKAERAYYGALQVFEALQTHWNLYHKGLAPRYRYFRGQLRIFPLPDDEYDRDTGLEQYWVESHLFQSVVWENLGLRYSIFESRDTFEVAKQLAELDQMLPDEVSVMADEILMRLRDERPQLCTVLYAACERLRAVTTRNSEEAAHSALSCRRFLIFLADFVAPAPETVNRRKIKDEVYRKRLTTYIKEHLTDDKKRSEMELDELEKAIKNLYGDASNGVHDHVSTAELDDIIQRLVTFTYRVLQLAPPPLTLPDEPYEEDLRMFLLKKQDD